LPADAGTSAEDHIYLIDPLGNLMMRFPKDPDPGKMKKDISKLLRASSIG
jgi:glutathione peroxidase-family protein